MTNILTQLKSYCTSDAKEALMVAKTITFIEQNEDCLERSNSLGHLTGSAWILDKTRTFALLTHHQKLDKWLQLGGHADGNEAVLCVALKEAKEEAGLKSVQLIRQHIFDVDVHIIPEYKGVLEHKHYDIRYLLEADMSEPLTVSSESKTLAWLPINEVEKINADESVMRMVRKVQCTKY